LHTRRSCVIDGPLERDPAPRQPLRNGTWVANLISDRNKYLRVGLELTYRKTASSLVPNNKGLEIQTQFQLRFYVAVPRLRLEPW
jgi:hypothetical protein